MADYSRRVVINCAGTVSQISYFLLSKYPSTLLCKLASTPNLSASHQGFDIFVDRDPAAFNVILNWYRYGKIVIPTNVPTELIVDDIAYFQLPVSADSLRFPPASSVAAPVVVVGGAGPFLGIPSPALSPQVSVSAGGSLARADSFQLAPSLLHAQSIAAPIHTAAPEQQQQQQPAINILPPTPPQLTPAVSTAPAAAALQPQRSMVAQPLLVHQPSGAFSGMSSPIAAAAASGKYSSLGAGDMDESLLLNQGSVNFPFSHPPPTQRSVSAVVPHSTPSSATGVQLPSGHHRASTGASGALISPATTPTMQKSFSTATPYNTTSNTPTHASSSKNAGTPSLPPTISEEHSHTSNLSTEISNPISPAAPQALAPTPAATQHTTPVIDTSSQSNSNTPLTSPSAAAFSHYASAIASPSAAVADSAPSSSSTSISITPAPRAPFDLQIDMLSCYKEISRVEAQTLLENAPDGSYIFRPCSDANEKIDGKNNPNLFVLTYLHEKKVYNVKIHRLYIGEKNRISASTCRGFVFSELKEPQAKEQCFNSIFGLTIAIIGQNAQELQQAM